MKTSILYSNCIDCTFSCKFRPCEETILSSCDIYNHKYASNFYHRYNKRGETETEGRPFEDTTTDCRDNFDISEVSCMADNMNAFIKIQTKKVARATFNVEMKKWHNAVSVATILLWIDSECSVSKSCKKNLGRAQKMIDIADIWNVYFGLTTSALQLY